MGYFAGFFNLMFVGMVKFIIQALGEKSLQSFYPVVLMRFFLSSCPHELIENFIIW